MVWVSWHLRPIWFPKAHCQQSSPSSDTLHTDARKDLSKGFETHEGSNWSNPIIISICLALDLIRLSFGVPPTVGMPGTFKNRYAWCMTKTPRAPKNGALSALERQKCLRCGAEKQAVLRCIEAPALSIFCCQIMDCSMPRWVKTWSGSRFRLHALQPVLIVSSAAMGWKHARCEKNHLWGSRAMSREK